MKKVYRLVVVRRNNSDHEIIFNKEFDNSELALDKAKNIIIRKKFADFNGIAKHVTILDLDELTVENLLVENGITYCIEADKDFNIIEYYMAIREIKITWKDNLRDTFEWFVAFLIWPYILVKGILNGLRISKNYPIDVISRYQDELRNTPISNWEEVYNKYFEEEKV